MSGLITTTPTTPTVRIIEVRFLEDEVHDGGIPQACYDNATVTDYDIDVPIVVNDAVRVLQREGLTFAATGTDYAANPDGSYTSNYATGERVETTGHLYGFSDAVVAAIMREVG